MSTDNQQERLAITKEMKWFLAGLIEGEGSLVIAIKKQPTAKFGFYVDTEFFLYQHRFARELLEMAQRIFGSGWIRPKSGNPDVLVYGITSRRTIEERVIPFYEKYMRYSSKLKWDNFLRFKEATRIFQRKEHMTREGILKLID